MITDIKHHPDTALAALIAEYLADQNNDPMCRFYQSQADDILAMVREADRARNRSLSAQSRTSECVE